MHSCPWRSFSTDLGPQRGDLRQLLGEVPWLRGLEEAQFQALLDASRVQVAAQREWLFHQRSPAHWVYLVIKGGVRLVRRADDDRLATIRCVVEGGTLGELSLVTPDGVYLYAAEALKRTQVLAMPVPLCREFVADRPAAYMACLVEELSERLEDLTMLTQADAMARLVSYLLRHLPAETAARREIPLLIPKRWLAAQLAMSPETLSRLLGKLRQRGALEVARDRLVVRDEAQLREIGRLAQ